MLDTAICNQYMNEAIDLAYRGIYTTWPNPKVGCVIVNNGKIVGQGWHQQAGGKHAEIIALEQAGSQAENSTVYVTLEPCSHFGRTPPCVDALIAAKVAKVVIAQPDPNPIVAGKGIIELQQHGIVVEQGLLQQQAWELNCGYNQRHLQQKPYVRLKLAATLDGKIAAADGSSRWISGFESRRDVHLLRARSSAIITTVATVMADNPELSVRAEEHNLPPFAAGFTAPQPVIIDATLTVPLTAKVLQQPQKCIIVTATIADNNKATKLAAAGHEVVALPQASDSNKIDLPQLLYFLAEKQIDEVLIEAGANFAGVMLQEKLVDEIIIYLAPKFLGNGKNLLEIPAIKTLTEHVELDIKQIEKIGDDVKIIAIPLKD